MARDRKFQAILPLRGKILNVERKDDAKLYDNAEIGALIVGLGLGLKGESIANLRYGKVHIHVQSMPGFLGAMYHMLVPSRCALLAINQQHIYTVALLQVIILTDADVDGAHIRTLLLTFLFRYSRQLFEVSMTPPTSAETGIWLSAGLSARQCACLQGVTGQECFADFVYLP